MNGSTLTVRDANPEEAWEIRHVLQETWIDTYPNEDHGITREDIVERWTNKTLSEEDEKLKEHEERIRTDTKTHTFVAEVMGVLIGVLIVIKGEERNKIGAFYVLPAYQRQGIGKHLLEQGMDWLGREKPTYLSVVTYNQKAISFYTKLGFRENGETTTTSAVLPSGKTLPEIEMVLE